jgi:hypothetical protein
LTLQDFTEVVAYIKTQRSSSESFDIAAPGVTPLDPAKGAEIVQPYLEAGVTWWIEAINQGVGSLEQMRERIRSGPPRL